MYGRDTDQHIMNEEEYLQEIEKVFLRPFQAEPDGKKYPFDQPEEFKQIDLKEKFGEFAGYDFYVKKSLELKDINEMQMHAHALCAELKDASHFEVLKFKWHQVDQQKAKAEAKAEANAIAPSITRAFAIFNEMKSLHQNFFTELQKAVSIYLQVASQGVASSQFSFLQQNIENLFVREDMLKLVGNTVAMGSKALFDPAIKEAVFNRVESIIDYLNQIFTKSPPISDHLKTLIKKYLPTTLYLQQEPNLKMTDAFFALKKEYIELRKDLDAKLTERNKQKSADKDTDKDQKQDDERQKIWRQNLSLLKSAKYDLVPRIKQLEEKINQAVTKLYNELYNELDHERRLFWEAEKAKKRQSNIAALVAPASKAIPNPEQQPLQCSERSKDLTTTTNSDSHTVDLSATATEVSSLSSSPSNSKPRGKDNSDLSQINALQLKISLKLKEEMAQFLKRRNLLTKDELAAKDQERYDVMEKLLDKVSNIKDDVLKNENPVSNKNDVMDQYKEALKTAIKESLLNNKLDKHNTFKKLGIYLLNLVLFCSAGIGPLIKRGLTGTWTFSAVGTPKEVVEDTLKLVKNFDSRLAG